MRQSEAAPKRKVPLWNRFWLAVALVIIATIGFWAAGGAADRQPDSIVLQALQSQTCLIPSLLMGILLFYYLGVQLYYLTARLEARIRQLRADAAYSEAQAAHRAAQVSDLTATAQGKILPRLVQDEATGRLLLVDPDLGTRPVLDIDPDTLPEDDPRLRALALINKLSATTASTESGGDKMGVGRGGPALNDVLAAALVLTGGLQNMDERLPPHIRVLSADETEALPDNE